MEEGLGLCYPVMKMAKGFVKIKYLYHSGFMVEAKNHLFIFDYFKGKVDFGEKTPLVFSSHSHQDHFNPEIFQWEKEKPGINYILSDDIPVPYPKSNYYSMSPYQEIRVGDVRIRTYGSTDLGVSYLVQCEGVTLFHAGDLNWWHWWDDSPSEMRRAEEAYKREIERIKGEAMDVAFFPVDPRLKDYYSRGADYFIREIAPQILIPMHFGEDTALPGQYAAQMNNKRTRIVMLKKSNQEITLEI
jgi:L-ascorbate metabolism protein UlaG (beta-lactamase superfamily)